VPHIRGWGEWRVGGLTLPVDTANQAASVSSRPERWPQQPLTIPQAEQTYSGTEN